MTIFTHGNPFKKWDRITGNISLKNRQLVVESVPYGGDTYYTIALLSKWWLIRKIQLWAIKKAFK